MSVFICEKCGRLDNSVNRNNFWVSKSNKRRIKAGESLFISFKNEYFNTHSCCSECCKGLQYSDGSGTNFIGDKYDCVTEKTYKEMKDEDIRCCENYEEIMKRDKITREYSPTI